MTNRTALDKAREALDAAIEAGHSNSNNSLEDMLQLVDDAREALSALSAIEAEAVGGLKPFAEAADDLDDAHRDNSPIWEAPAAMSIDAGDLRRARAFLARHKGGDDA